MLATTNLSLSVCLFFLAEIEYEVNITNCTYGQTERAVLKGLRTKIQFTTLSANQLLKQLVTQRSKDAPINLYQRQSQTKNFTMPKSHLSVDFETHLYFPGGHWIPKSCKTKWKVRIGRMSRTLHLMLFSHRQ